MRSLSPTGRDLIDGLTAALRSLLGVSVFAVDENASFFSNVDLRVDALLAPEVLGRPARLLIETKTYGYPRDLVGAASHLRHYIETAQDPSLR